MELNVIRQADPQMARIFSKSIVRGYADAPETIIFGLHSSASARMAS